MNYILPPCRLTIYFHHSSIAGTGQDLAPTNPFNNGQNPPKPEVTVHQHQPQQEHQPHHHQPQQPHLIEHQPQQHHQPTKVKIVEPEDTEQVAAAAAVASEADRTAEAESAGQSSGGFKIPDVPKPSSSEIEVG